MKVFVSYNDVLKGKTKIVEGIFDLIKLEDNYIKIQSKENIMFIPYQRVNKIKMKRRKI